ncbi:helix-turn-helix domain-containing protein [Staphylococcus sp. NAM3COL9]|uniref:helix-turn-helix domain-containing protein n=1 Tax=Staphylococcus sp. NAM3COL9 TaxID=1667172 RepID=UPI00070C3FA1
MHFSKKLKDVRAEHKITQEKFANDIQVSIQSVNKWENNKSYPDLFNLIDIANYYEISIDSLLANEIKHKNSKCSKKRYRKFFIRIFRK